MRGDGVLQGSGTVDQRIDAERGEDDVAAPQRPQVALHLVGEALCVAILDHAGEALEGVVGAKQFLADARIGARLPHRFLEGKQRVSNRRQVLVALREVVGEESVAERGHAVPDAAAAVSRDCACAASACGANGLVMKALAPACSAAWRLASSPRVVRTTTGSVRYLP
jgi:hypothetical protein